jgi:hypothetical protein
MGQGGGKLGILPCQEGNRLPHAEWMGQGQNDAGKEICEASLGDNAEESRENGPAENKIFKSRPQKGHKNDSPNQKISYIEKIPQGEYPVGVDVTFETLHETRLKDLEDRIAYDEDTPNHEGGLGFFEDGPIADKMMDQTGIKRKKKDKKGPFPHDGSFQNMRE